MIEPKTVQTPERVAEHYDELDRWYLAIWGEHDNVIPLSHADLLLKHVPHSRKVVVPQAGHALYMDDATTFHKELIRFLKQLEKP